MKKIIGLLAGFAMLGSSHAAVVTYNFTARVDLILESLAPTYYPAQKKLTTLTGMTVTAGQEIHGSFSYDTAMGLSPDYQPAPPSSGTATLYLDPDNATKITAPSLFIPPKVLLYEANLMQIANNAATPSGGDDFSLSHILFSRDGSRFTSTISLLDFGGAAFDHGGVPASLTLSSFNYATYYMTYYLATGGYVDVRSTITALTPAVATAVPEQETYAMLVAGLALLGWRTRKRA